MYLLRNLQIVSQAVIFYEVTRNDVLRGGSFKRRQVGVYFTTSSVVYLLSNLTNAEQSLIIHEERHLAMLGVVKALSTPPLKPEVSVARRFHSSHQLSSKAVKGIRPVLMSVYLGS